MTGEQLHRHSDGQVEPLWACHACRMIGTEAEARAHAMVHSHDIARLTDEESTGIRQIWADDRAKRAVGFALAARRRGPFAALREEQQ